MLLVLYSVQVILHVNDMLTQATTPALLTHQLHYTHEESLVFQLVLLRTTRNSTHRRYHKLSQAIARIYPTGTLLQNRIQFPHAFLSDYTAASRTIISPTCLFPLQFPLVSQYLSSLLSNIRSPPTAAARLFLINMEEIIPFQQFGLELEFISDDFFAILVVITLTLLVPTPALQNLKYIVGCYLSHIHKEAIAFRCLLLDGGH